MIECRDGDWARFAQYPEGFDLCDNICTSLQDNEDHCGRCRNACQDGLECQGGSCGADVLQWQGVRNNVPIADVLGGGWEQCFTNRYSVRNGPLVLGEIDQDCDGAWLMLACRATGADTLRVAAHAPRADVLFDMGEQNATHPANGVGWYYGLSESWGFVRAGEAVNRNSCDTNSRADNTRLCWHTSSGRINNGWRCGDQTDLNGSNAWDRMVYHATP